MCTYLKNMAGWKPKDLKNKSVANIQELFDKAFKRVNTFVDFRIELVEGSEKMDDDQEAAKMKELIKIIPDEEEVAVDAIPLATKPPSIMLRSFDREDLETLWKLVKAKNGYYCLLRVNAAGINVTTAERIKTAKRVSTVKEWIKTAQRKDKYCLWDIKFTVKDLARLVDEIWLQTDRSGEETMWNNLSPKKVNIFVWRVLKGRLPILSELDKRGIDLNTLLCPCCDDNVETTDHSLLLCNMAWSVWVKFFKWWKGGNVDVFTIGELFKHNGFNSQSAESKKWWLSGGMEDSFGFCSLNEGKHEVREAAFSVLAAIARRNHLQMVSCEVLWKNQSDMEISLLTRDYVGSKGMQLLNLVVEPLKSMVMGAPFEDARHLAQCYDRMRQEAEAHMFMCYCIHPVHFLVMEGIENMIGEVAIVFLVKGYPSKVY
ncbi:RNA-directed DNA polymerase, eukaryota, reverse transcriptase zinc-binding domain protein [Tanacetum coccineum]